MRLPIRLGSKKHRSAGVPVSRRAYELIGQGNSARDQGHWQAAADLYHAALAERPDLTHIHIQLGHAFNELGRWSDAESAYRTASRLSPSSRDAIIHLGHVLKLRGKLKEAAQCYVSLARANPFDEEAMRESRDTLWRCPRRDSRDMAMSLLDRLVDRSADISRTEPIIDNCKVVYDVTDLIDFTSRFRRPTGIQRVQIEIITRAIRAGVEASETPGLCYFKDDHDGWVAVPPDAFLRLAHLALADDDGEIGNWQRARDELHLRLLASSPVAFARDAALVNLGNSWSHPNYLLHVRDARVRRQIRYIPMIYDLIPVQMPNAFTPALVRDFIAWLSDTFIHADAFLAISHATKVDLIAAANDLQCTLDPALITVIPLNAAPTNLSTSGIAASPANSLTNEPYILFVGTIEPRKGHLFAFDAWSVLIDRLGDARVPKLICVGRNGWCNDPIFDTLAGDHRLRRHISIVHDVSDDLLAELYRGCLFTIYPSLYEGWGLPVTESLCHCKVVITTNVSALPEAGGPFARYVPPADAQALADAVEQFIDQPDLRIAMEAQIAEGFRPRSWSAVAEQIGSVVNATWIGQPQVSGRASIGAVATPGVFYWLGRSNALGLRQQADRGEPFRAGVNWLPPDNNGCRVRLGEARLSLIDKREAPPTDRSVTVRLVGSPIMECPFCIVGSDKTAGALSPGERLSVTVRPLVNPDGRLEVTIMGMAESENPDHPRETISVVGFCLNATAPVHRRSACAQGSS